MFESCIEKKGEALGLVFSPPHPFVISTTFLSSKIPSYTTTGPGCTGRERQRENGQEIEREWEKRHAVGSKLKKWHFYLNWNTSPVLYESIYINLCLLLYSQGIPVMRQLITPVTKQIHAKSTNPYNGVKFAFLLVCLLCYGCHVKLGRAG